MLEKKSLYPMALLGVMISWISRAMPGQSQIDKGSDPGMKIPGSPSQALTSYPQPLNSQDHRNHDPVKQF